MNSLRDFYDSEQAATMVREYESSIKQISGYYVMQCEIEEIILNLKKLQRLYRMKLIPPRDVRRLETLIEELSTKYGSVG